MNQPYRQSYPKCCHSLSQVIPTLAAQQQFPVEQYYSCTRVCCSHAHRLVLFVKARPLTIPSVRHACLHNALTTLLSAPPATEILWFSCSPHWRRHEGAPKVPRCTLSTHTGKRNQTRHQPLLPQYISNKGVVKDEIKHTEMEKEPPRGLASSQPLAHDMSAFTRSYAHPWVH